jgi:hypothetical protein
MEPALLRRLPFLLLASYFRLALSDEEYVTMYFSFFVAPASCAAIFLLPKRKKERTKQKKRN